MARRALALVVALAWAFAGAALLPPPGSAQVPAGVDYRVQVDNVFAAARERQGKSALYVTLQFRLLRGADGKVATEVGPEDRIVVEEDGRPVADLEVQAPRANALTTVLAVDISGSMASSDKIEQARQAGQVFLDRLDPRADCGLILFDHLVRQAIEPVRDPVRRPAHRLGLRGIVGQAQAQGGTAYLDATARAIEMVRGVPGRRAVLVMTDGQDLHSRRKAPEVIALARQADVPVYTLGVGEPGRQEPVTTVLVLDKSGSMHEAASEGDELDKIAALKLAAGRFLEMMRPQARTTVLPFSSGVEQAEPFTADRESIRRQVNGLEANGETALYDAAAEAVQMLQAERPVGRKAVVVLTDGKDNKSRRRPEEVVAMAGRAETPIYMLGFGRANELNEVVMRQVAERTGGRYYHASNQARLFEVFESLSIQLHDDGIDEAALKQLAEQTGGRYYPARDVSKLALIYEGLADELQTSFTATFPSRRSSHDGTARGIDVKVVRGGVQVSDVGRADYNVHGVVVPEMDVRVYLGFLALLLGLLAVPSGLRRLYRFYGGT